MTLAFDDRYKRYDPVTPTTNFTVDFPLFDSDDLEVRVDGALYATYSVTATYVDGKSSDAVVVLVDPQSGVSVEIFGARDPRREANYLANSAELAAKMQLDVEAVTAVQQEMKRDIARALVLPVDGGIDPQFPALEEGYTVVGTGTGLAQGPSVGEISGAEANAAAAVAARTGAETAQAAAEAAVKLFFDTTPDLLGDTALDYTQVSEGDYIQTRKEGFAYRVAASGAVDHQLTTGAGGVVKLYVEVDGRPGIDLRTFGVTGSGDETTEVQAAIDYGADLKATGVVLPVIVPPYVVTVSSLTNASGVPIHGYGWRLTARPNYGNASFSSYLEGSGFEFTATAGKAYDHGTNAIPRQFGGGIRDVAFLGQAAAGVTGIYWRESLQETHNNILVANFEIGEEYEFIQDADFGVHHSMGNKKAILADADVFNEIGFQKLNLNSCGDPAYSDAGYAYNVLSGEPIIDIRRGSLITIHKALIQSNYGPVLSLDTTRYTGGATPAITGFSISNVYSENGAPWPVAQLIWAKGNVKSCRLQDISMFQNVRHVVINSGNGYVIENVNGLGVAGQSVYIEAAVTNSRVFDVSTAHSGVALSNLSAATVWTAAGGLLRTATVRVTTALQTLILSAKQTPPTGYLGVHAADTTVVGAAADPALVAVKDNGALSSGIYPT